MLHSGPFKDTHKRKQQTNSQIEEITHWKRYLNADQTPLWPNPSLINESDLFCWKPMLNGLVHIHSFVCFIRMKDTVWAPPIRKSFLLKWYFDCSRHHHCLVIAIIPEIEYMFQFSIVVLFFVLFVQSREKNYLVARCPCTHGLRWFVSLECSTHATLDRNNK